MIIDIFKIPLYQTDLDLDVSTYNDFCWKYQETNVSLVRSNALGYHSNNLLGGSIDNNIRKLKEAIMPHCIKFGNAIDFYCDKLTMDNMWFNINLHKDYNTEHFHPNAAISGVFYTAVPEDSGNLDFIHPSDGIQYTCDETNLRTFNNRYSASNWWYPSKVNRLFLFPGWLKHRVTVNKTKDPRISFSFNCVI